MSQAKTHAGIQKATVRIDRWPEDPRFMDPREPNDIRIQVGDRSDPDEPTWDYCHEIDVETEDGQPICAIAIAVVVDGEGFENVLEVRILGFHVLADLIAEGRFPVRRIDSEGSPIE
jgi:hypothetical protein